MSDTKHNSCSAKEESPEFRRPAEKHREFDIKIGEFDRIYYLTSEQERKRKELQVEAQDRTIRGSCGSSSMPTKNKRLSHLDCLAGADGGCRRQTRDGPRGSRAVL
jgi:hypothetical protein